MGKYILKQMKYLGAYDKLVILSTRSKHDEDLPSVRIISKKTMSVDVCRETNLVSCDLFCQFPLSLWITSQSTLTLTMVLKYGKQNPQFL